MLLSLPPIGVKDGVSGLNANGLRERSDCIGVLPLRVQFVALPAQIQRAQTSVAMGTLQVLVATPPVTRSPNVLFLLVCRCRIHPTLQVVLAASGLYRLAKNQHLPKF